MSVELRPLGVKCNIQCQYCYQNPQRDAGNVGHEYDLEKMRAALGATGKKFTLFGGEPLLIPMADLEEILSWGFDGRKGNSIQTNGTLLTDEHIRVFKKYRVSVGVSVDGPVELNDARWAGTLSQTRLSSVKTHEAIARLCEAKVTPSVIVTLHRGNATADKLPLMHEWMRSLDRLGVRSARLHALEVESGAVGQKYALSASENVAALLSFAALERELPTLRFAELQDMRALLVGDDRRTSCVWNACDPYTTRAVQGIEGHGQRSNCGRTNKDGIDFVKAETEGFERYYALYHTPWEHGGCNGCRFFLMCKGQCPGTSIDGDWRNRTEHCEVWMTLFERLETELVEQGREPLSLSADRGRVEAQLLEAWRGGKSRYLHQALTRLAAEDGKVPAPPPPAGLASPASGPVSS